MTKKVYVVIHEGFDCTTILGVYSTQEKAYAREAICMEKHRYVYVEELELDEDIEWTVS